LGEGREEKGMQQKGVVCGGYLGMRLWTGRDAWSDLGKGKERKREK
jgi:hypothetical protein